MGGWRGSDDINNVELLTAPFASWRRALLYDWDVIGISSFSVVEICFGHFGEGREEGGSLGVVRGEVLFRLLILI